MKLIAQILQTGADPCDPSPEVIWTKTFKGAIPHQVGDSLLLSHHLTGTVVHVIHNMVETEFRILIRVKADDPDQLHRKSHMEDAGWAHWTEPLAVEREGKKWLK